MNLKQLFFSSVLRLVDIFRSERMRNFWEMKKISQEIDWFSLFFIEFSPLIFTIENLSEIIFPIFYFPFVDFVFLFEFYLSFGFPPNFLSSKINH